MTATRAGAPEAPAPTKPAPTVDAYLRGTAVTSSVVQFILFLLVAGLAASRASGSVLSATAVCAIVAVAAGSSIPLAWIGGLYGAAVDVRKLSMDVPERHDHDPLAAGPMWRGAALWSLGAAAWAAAGGGLVVVALDGRVARFPVLLGALVGLAGVATLAVGNAARHVGLRTATLRPATAVPLRTRAWKHFALPIGVLQGLVNAGVAWVLFHDYGPGGIEPLTDKVALADALVVVTLLTLIFGGLSAWGAHDAATGRIVFDDARTQALGTAPRFGVQGLVYCAITALLAFRLAGLLLPAHPSLAAVIITRGVLAGVIVGVVTGVSYVRGACNEGVRA